ncbi:hypothetical protein [Actinoplanes sp. NPDC049802]|uniref:hypothetical protein n=1 Tax=Actinoplanes sp. NPDC049802 TaxID=3154742 RepID=UPI0033BFC702
MIKVSERAVPVRDDQWKPTNPLLDSVIRKYIDEARSDACDTTGNSATITAGGLVLVGFGVVLSMGTGDPLLAIAIVVVLSLLGLAYAGVKAPPLRLDPLQILAPLGGPGNLPAGYLVHPLAWRAGMPEYVAGVPERRMRIAVALCRTHPGAVTDLLRLVERAERFVALNQTGREFTDAGREAEIMRIAARTVEDQVSRVPVPSVSGGRKGRKKK